MPTSAPPHTLPAAVPTGSPRAGVGSRMRVGLAAAGLVVVLVVNLPGFLRTPLDCDPLLFDLYVRDMSHGAVLYRDMLENNTPAMIALHAGVRSVFGWSPEALRAADLLVVGAAVGLLGWWPHRGRPDRKLLTVTLLAGLYLSTSEWCHVQRDVWMLLPVMGALYLRRGQAGRLAAGRGSYAAALAEGAVWGLAVWIKPHVVFVAGPVWLVAAAWARSRGASWRAVLADAAGVFVGGLVVGAAGVGLMAAAGMWRPYLDHLSGWAGEYSGADLYRPQGSWFHRLGFAVRYMPWSVAYAATVPLAAAIAVGAAAVRRPGDCPDRAVLAAALVGWAAQAWLLQHVFDYVHVGGMMLAVALLADLPAGPSGKRLALAGLVGLTVLGHAEVLRDRAAVWADCLGAVADRPEVRDRLCLIPRWRWADLDRVSGFLVAQGARDGEVAVLSDTALPVWTLTGLRPPTRYYLVHNNLCAFPGHRAEILAELSGVPNQRFVVCDLAALRWGQPPTGCEGRPAEEWPLPADWHGSRRWADRVVFRSGRYLVLAMPAADVSAWIADVTEL